MANLSQLITEKANKYGLPVNVLTELIRAESSFNPNAKSAAGAMGLSQLMPGTARSLGVTNPYDPEQNLEGGAKYLSQQLKQFGSLPLALAAYNAGPGNVQKYGRIPPFAETQAYVKKIMGSLDSGGGVPSLPAQSKGQDNARGSVQNSGSGVEQALNPTDRLSAFRTALDNAFTPIETPEASNIAAQTPQIELQPMQAQAAAMPGLSEDEVNMLTKLFGKGAMGLG